MTGSRCPACGASTPDGATWCSLCYADLRPAPAVDVPAATVQPSPAAPTAAPATPVPPGNGPAGRLDPLTAPISTLLETPAAVLETPAQPAVSDPAPALPAVVSADADLDPAEGATWPCQRCGAAVELAADACPECGAGFLAGALPTVELTVPIVGNVARLSSGQRFGLAAGLAVGLIVVFMLVVFVGGAVL